MRKWLKVECDRAGGIRAFARRAQISPGHISRVLRGEKQPGPFLLGWVGLEAVTTYRRKSS